MKTGRKLDRGTRQSGRLLALTLGLISIAVPGPALADVLGFYFTSGFGIHGSFGNDGCTAQSPVRSSTSPPPSRPLAP